MRYYIYISDTKLEMLYEQVPLRHREKIASELSIDLGIVKAKFSSVTVKNARHQKIQIVQKYLGKRVGWLNEKHSYIYGRAIVAWGPFGNYPNVVYFGGHNDGWQIGLMGSHSNCIGAEGLSSPTGYSLSRYIIDLLSNKKCLPLSGFGKLQYSSAQEILESACRGVTEANICSIKPNIEIEFLARTIAYQPKIGKGSSVFIGSPIYVAECD